VAARTESKKETSHQPQGMCHGKSSGWHVKII
jgi:hypothetical protein